MASINLQEKANFTRLSRLLVDKGTEAIRNAFDAIHPPASLPTALNANRKSLLRLRYRIINSQQWDLLFPSSGNSPDSKTFGIVLLSVLLRNICGLSSPATGWDAMPRDTDRSVEANVTRIKLFRNQIYSHVSSTEVDKAAFENLWQKISHALVDLNIPQKEIDDLKTCCLGPEEEIYRQRLEEQSIHWAQFSEERESPETWAWEINSITHREMFHKLFEYGQDHLQDIQVVNDVRFCSSTEFRIGMGSDGTRVYVGLSKDGYERAVKRLPKDSDYSIKLAEQEKKILNQPNAMKSNHVVKYRFLDKSNKDFLFLFMDLCEETLEDYVKSSVLDGWSKKARDIVGQVLKGLADLHRGPIILHRDLKPRNVLRDTHGNWLIADFGISRILPHGVSTYRSKERGTDYWKAVESCSNDTSNNDDVGYKTKSDIQVAGMVAFYAVTKGKHPYGEEPDQKRNLLDGSPVGLVNLQDPAAKDLISWMLSHDAKDRPSAEEALKHPYLQPAEQQFKMLSEMGNQHEIKTRRANSNVKTELNKLPNVWQDQMDPDVLQYLCTDVVTGDTYRYGSSWSELLRFIRNVNQHWHDTPRPLPQPHKEFYLVGDPQEYFLNLFPNLPVEVHKIVRSCDWKERPKLKEYFMANIKDKS